MGIWINDSSMMNNWAPILLYILIMPINVGRYKKHYDEIDVCF